MPDPAFRNEDLKVSKVICRPCARKHGQESATFNRPAEAVTRASYRCPRCGSANIEVRLTI